MAALRSDTLPPESPAYIRLPQPPQSDDVTVSRVKGHLPVPRNIFPTKNDIRKVDPDYITRTAPKRSVAPQSTNATQIWKAKLAQSRRNNLETGLQALWQRQDRAAAASAVRASRNTQMHKQAATAPERDDDRLTRGTILESVLDTKVVLDPLRHERVAESKIKVEKLDAAKREARQESLIDLYINSAKFIVHESELKSEIEKLFADDYFKAKNASKGTEWAADNAWGAYGPPPGLSEMLPTTGESPSRYRSDAEDGQYRRAIHRQKRIAEEFTGGHLD